MRSRSVYFSSQSILSGIGRNRWSRLLPQMKGVTIPWRKQESVQETIRRTVSASLPVWNVSLLTNLRVFEGSFSRSVREQEHKREEALEKLNERLSK